MSDMIRSLLNRNELKEPSEPDFRSQVEDRLAKQEKLRNSGRFWSETGGLEYCPRMGTWMNLTSGRAGSLKNMCEGTVVNKYGG